jgi:hypothetical protein
VSVKALERASEPSLHLVVPSYYVMSKLLQTVPRESRTIALFRRKLQELLDAKFWTSIKALHWIATFLEPSFKTLAFLPNLSTEDIAFKTGLERDLRRWLMTEMTTVSAKLNASANKVAAPASTVSTDGRYGFHKLHILWR